MKLKQAESEAEIQQARELFAEYAAWLGVDFRLQDFAKELRELPGDYAPPSGRLLLASTVGDGNDEGQLSGCVALHKIAPGTCELKRLYVRPEFRGRGLGRQLGEVIITEARSIGYTRMLLDTLPRRMEQAEKLYYSLGFKEIEAYYYNEIEGVLYMELML